MNKEDLFNELGNIDPKYIEEAETSAEAIRKNMRYARKKWIALAAAFIIMIGAASRFEAVQAAIKKMFTFIPGVGIEETTGDSTRPNPEVLYSMDGDPVSLTDGNISVTLQNAYISSYSVDIVYRVKLDFMPENAVYLSKEEMQELLDENGVSSFMKIKDYAGLDSFNYTFIDIVPTVTVDGVQYSDLQTYGGGSINDMTCTVRISGIKDALEKYGQNIPVTLSIGDLSFDIGFKPIETYDSIDEIGPTAMHNGISLTVVPRWDGDTLYVKFYSLNYSEFSQVYGFVAYDEEKTILPYILLNGETIPAQYEGGDGTEFYFDLSSLSLTEEQKSSLELHVPVVNVRNDENTVIEFTVNPDGTIDHPGEASLSHCDIFISDMKVSNTENWENGIEIYFTAEPKEDNLYLSSITLTNINGGTAGSSGSWTYNDKGQWAAGFKKDSIKRAEDYKSIKISSAEYTLTDEYVFLLQ